MRSFKACLLVAIFIFGLPLFIVAKVFAQTPRMEVKLGYQSNRGGGLSGGTTLSELRTSFQVAPALSWRWFTSRFRSDLRLGMALGFPAHRKMSQVENLNAQWKVRFLPTSGLQLEAGVRLGRTLIDSVRSRWKKRVQLDSDFSGLARTLGDIYLKAGYRLQLFRYNDEVPAPSISLTERKDLRQSLHVGPLWLRGSFWMWGGVGVSSNRSSQTAYDFNGTNIYLGGGFQSGRFQFTGFGRYEKQHYFVNRNLFLRFFQISISASFQVTPWGSLYGNVHRNQGNLDGRLGLEPLVLAQGGFKLGLDKFKRKPESPNSKRPKPIVRAKGTHTSLRPIPTDRGWLFRLQHLNANSVHLVGTFKKWDTQNFQLKEIKAGLWELYVDLEEGVYEYAFLVNGSELVSPPQAQRYVLGKGGKNIGYLVVP